MTGREASSLRPLLEARSVAVVGASPRRGSPGHQMMLQLLSGGFTGIIAPVNPHHEEIEGRRCWRSLKDVPGPIDLVILGVPNRLLEAQLRRAAELGVPAAVIFASGHGDDDGTALTERLIAIGRDANMSICGGNCMGFVNFDHNLRALAFEERPDLRAGHITWITHSGSAFSALLHNDRGLRFNLAVSAGREFTTTVADYIAYAVTQPSTRVIALFLETVRDPSGFRAALDAARNRDIVVVALKVGREAAAKQLVRAHSGALAGEDAVADALFEAHGVRRVRSLNELGETLELLAAGRRARRGGLAAIHDSGGERAHLIDAAAEVGVPFARISDRTVRRLEQVLEAGLPAVNPLDAWGTGNDFETIFVECMRTLAADPDAAALAFVVDLAGEDLEGGYAAVAEQIFAETTLPVAVLSNFSSGIDPAAARRLRDAGVPVLEDTFDGLAAVRHLFEIRDFRAPTVTPVEARNRASVRARWERRLQHGRPWTETEALRLLSDYGVPTAATTEVTSLAEAAKAAERLGYPVALKRAGVEHKSDQGGVWLGLESSDLPHAYASMAERFGPHLLVQAMAPGGVEMALGMIRDEQFGAVVMVAAGGVLIELVGDRKFGMPPLDARRARRMVDSLRSRPVLDGIRGAAPADVDALVDALVSFSALAADLGAHIEALDVNPVIVGPKGCTAVDALVVPEQG
jgi:acyl-CoA synthetase (NDP forming)